MGSGSRLRLSSNGLPRSRAGRRRRGRSGRWLSGLTRGELFSSAGSNRNAATASTTRKGVLMSDQKQSSYRLTSSEVPKTRRSGFYAAIIREFQEMEEESVLVSDTGKKPMTLQQGLRKALKTQGIDDVRMVQRGEETYLVKASRGAERSKD